jgi:hypothetical protein
VTGPASAGWARHRPFLAVLAAGAVLRVLAFAAYRPALEFYGDSYTYLADARRLTLDRVRPFGYSAFLRALTVPDLMMVTAVQHLLGLALGAALYVGLTRRGVGRGLATAAAAPVLLDAYQVDIEQLVMAETLFSALLVAGVAVVTWTDRPRAGGCALAGLLLACATLTRTVALGLAAVVLPYLLVRRAGCRGAGAFLAAFSLPLAGYAALFHLTYGPWALGEADGVFLWGRVAPFADCRRAHLAPALRALCSPHPPADRPGPNYYDWAPTSPLVALAWPPRGPRAGIGRAALSVIAAQPGDYLRSVAGDTLHFFAPGRRVGRQDWYVGSWYFPTPSTPRLWHVSQPLVDLAGHPAHRHDIPVVAGLLRGYQRVGYTPGPLLAACCLLGLLPAAARSGRRRVRADCVAGVGMGMLLLVIPSATATFDYRYLLPTLVLLPPAAALAGQEFLAARALRSSPGTTSGPAMPTSVSPAPPGSGRSTRTAARR